MMDSTNITENPTDNLDEYGVWVKKAPKASENDVSNENESLGSSKSDESAEVTDIPNSPIDSDADSLSLDATEEVSLDDFLGDEALDDTVTSDDAQENKMDFSSEEEVSLDEFLDTDDKEDTAVVASDEIEEEPPLDIDLDFSDENTEDISSQEESEPSVIVFTVFFFAVMIHSFFIARTYIGESELWLRSLNLCLKEKRSIWTILMIFFQVLMMKAVVLQVAKAKIRLQAVKLAQIQRSVKWT